MPVGQMIAIGVGSPADIIQLVLTGLESAPTGLVGVESASIVMGTATVLAADTIYVMPPRIVDIEWLSTGAARIDGSLDQANWSTVDTASVAGNRQILRSIWPFIRPTDSITILCRKAAKL
jgi:hypothetical protein